jgi:ATP-dependent helicase/nuclease subunit A
VTLFEALLVDDDARRTIRDDLARNLFVEAGAGTGKTTVLVDRVVNLFATGTLTDPSALVAITFTEAAASELRNRIRLALDAAAADGAQGADERERCSEARRRIDEAAISTLHGFAQRILAEHPLEAGLPPRFEVDDGVLAGVRFAERWVAFLDDLYTEPTAARDLLIAHALGLSAGHLLEIARQFHDRWDRVVGVDLEPRVQPPPIDAAPIIASLRAALDVAGDRIGADDSLSCRLLDIWLPLLDRVVVASSDPDDIEVLRAIEWLPAVGSPGRKDFWGDDKALIIEHLTAAMAAAVDLASGHRMAALDRLVPRIAAFTEAGVRERQRAGVLEFHDLLVHARDLLRGSAAVRTALAERYQAILIDEFQDTDPLQLDIAFLLAAADPASEPPAHWRDTELAEGKLLIVGDPKQSIYAFRGADISVWDEARTSFHGQVVQLAQNFRTVPTIVEWVNEVFAEIIGDGRPRSQPAYHPLAAAREPMMEGPAVVLLGGPADGRIDELRAAEAGEIARLLRLVKHDQWRITDQAAPQGTRPVRYDDVAILLPTRTSLGHLERALDGAAVPYRIESRSLVWATDAVRDLLAVLAAIDDPADDIAVVAALRSPGFACSDVDLLDWRAAGGRWDHRREPPEGVANGHPVSRAMAALKGYHDVRNNDPVDLLVERIVRERHLVELTFAQRRPRDHWRRLRFVIDQARAFVEAGGRSLGELLAWAELQTAEGAAVVETPAPESDDDAVRILTIHGSKGLEFPIVVLSGLGTRLQAGGPLVTWGGARPEVAVGRKDSRFTTPGFAAAAADIDNASADEGHRLLYVAATRSRDHLVVGLTHSPGGPSHAKQLWAVATDEPGERLSHLARRIAVADQLSLELGAAAVALPPTIDVDERDRWLAEHDALLARANAPRALSPTGLSGQPDDPLEAPDPPVPVTDDVAAPIPSARRRGGTAVGRAVHGVLQTVELGPPADVTSLLALATHLATAEGVPEAAADVAALAASSLASVTVRSAAAASRRWREVPVTVPLGAGRTLEGYIDLLYEDADGNLVVVDHKTDRERDPERYRRQLAAYAFALEAVLGRPVGRAVLVYADPGGAVEAEVDDLTVAVAEVRTLVG